MSLISDFLQLGQLRMEADTGSEVFTWKGTDYPCVANSLQAGLDIGIGPKGEDISEKLIIRRSLFTGAIPVAGQTGVFRGSTYRIATVSEDGARSHVTVFLTSVNK